MKKTTIRHTLRSGVALVMAILALASCMKDDKIETTPTCVITAFSIGSIKSEVPATKYDSEGNAIDTFVTRSISGSSIYFNINQVEGHIYTTDSLPNWTDLTAVVPSFASHGDVYAKLNDEQDLFYPILSGSSTIDFSKTVQLMCISTDGSSRRFYNVDIYKHEGNTDTLEWKPIATDLAIQQEGQVHVVGNKVFTFARDAAGANVVTTTSTGDGTTWSTPKPIPVEAESVVPFGEAFYGLDSEGYIYSTPANQDATAWEKAADHQVERLLAADAYYLYAYDGTSIVGTTDLATWTLQGTADLDQLPEAPISAISCASRTNQQLQVAVMAGLSSHNDEHSVVWYKTSSDDPNINQQWAYIQVTPDNSYGLPRLGHLSMTAYKNALFAIGTTEGKYEYLYRSDDNGITWHPQTQMYPIPEGLDPANGTASIVAVGSKLWIIQENGNLWEGSIQ